MATGGTITTIGGYTIHTFKVADSGTNFVNDITRTVDFILVAGGGGGGGVIGGGGGGGGVIVQTGVSLSSGTFPVTVGAGGEGGIGYSHPGQEKGFNGGNSTFNSLTAIGGGGGGGYDSGDNAGDGGSGGGAGYQNGSNTDFGTGTAGQGNNGGTMYIDYNAGGGGGAGSVGGNGTTSGVTDGFGGNGGSGISNTFSGSSVTYGGGGGGASRGTPGTGTDGGGNGTNTTTKAGNGANDRGGGGGGGGFNSNSASIIGGTGGSGIVIIRYLSNQAPNTPTNSNPTNGSTGISRNPTLTASAFSDPDVGNTHGASQWQVATDSGFTSVIWDSGADTSNLTSITVNTTNGTFSGTLSGKTKLSPSITYYFHVRYKDNIGAWSSYSTGTSFATVPGAINKNAVDVQSPWTIDSASSEMLPDLASKPSTVGVGDEIPSDSPIEGTVRLIQEDESLEWYINAAWHTIFTLSTLDARYVNVTGDTMTGDLKIQSDSKKIFFGAGDDMSIYYDGTNGHINPKEVGSGYASIDGIMLSTDKIAFTQTDLNEYIDSLGDGYLDYRATTAHRFGDGTNYTNIAANGLRTMVGNARVHREIRVFATATSKGASAPTTTLRSIGASGNVKKVVDQYSKTTQQDVYFEFHPNYDMDDSVNVQFHIMWVPGSSWTTGNYVWKLEYLLKYESSSYGSSDLTTGTPTTISMDVTPSNAHDMIETEFTSTIDLNIHQILMCHFYRDVANDNADDTGDVNFFEVEYVKNSDGEGIV